MVDRTGVLREGLAAIRTEFDVPAQFPADVLAAAEQAARRSHPLPRELTGLPFVTLDPEGATDLDQAFAFERADAGAILLHYAIADVASFVTDSDSVGREAWERGSTVYLPDGKAPLHPPVLSEGAASLLPGVDRPAIIFTLRVEQDGAAPLDRIERAVVRSQAKLAYETVRVGDLPAEFQEVTARLAAAERARGAARIDPPEQEVQRTADGRFTLAFRPKYATEEANAQLSLAVNIAVAGLLRDARTGLFRVMPAPSQKQVQRLRITARALGVAWSPDETLAQLEKRLDPAQRNHASLMAAIRRAGGGASYAPFDPDTPPWHNAVAAPYAHATAPLRRLADRHVGLTALALANGGKAEESIAAAFPELAKRMTDAEIRSARIDRAVIDLAEAVVLEGREGESFAATILESDERMARVQLETEPVVARVADLQGAPGDRVTLRLRRSSPATRQVDFEAME